MNRDLEHLIAAVNAEPTEMLPRMALADWWEEQGEGELATMAREYLCEPVRCTMQGWVETGVGTVGAMREGYGVQPIGLEIVDREPFRSGYEDRNTGSLGPIGGGYCWFLPHSSREGNPANKAVIPPAVFAHLKRGIKENRRELCRYVFVYGIGRLESDVLKEGRETAMRDLNQAALA